jgi:phenylalanyl-tRNA synthetase beta chain
MKLSGNWLNDYVNIDDLSPEELSLLLTMTTCEVDGVEYINDFLDQVVIGKMQSIEKHPEATKLSFCKVDIGQKVLPIVCGAPNISVGQKVAVAVPGCALPSGITIKKSNIRGVESEGMICSEKELNLSENADEIYLVPDNFQIGKKLNHYLHRKDYILEIDNKSITHRPDLWGHFGFARELSAVLQRPIKTTPGGKTKILDTLIDKKLKCLNIEIIDDAAINYCGLIIKNVKIAPSPDWLQTRLQAIDAKPINNVVDISNYIMFELGQPNHPFDRQLLGKKILIYLSKKGKKFTTLDDEVREIPTGCIMIADDKRDVALGGIMGGQNSEIKDHTSCIFLESACFPRANIRKSLSKLGLRTDAAVRFEKGLSPTNSIKAVYRFVDLLHKCCPDIRISNINAKINKNLQNKRIINRKIQLAPEMVTRRLGKKLTKSQITSILKRLKFGVSSTTKKWQITVPDFRSYYDISVPIDLVEEIGRIYRYDNIEEKEPLVPCLIPLEVNPSVRLQAFAKDLFVQRYGFTEVYLYSFYSEEDHNIASENKNTVELLNPISQSLKIMRCSLIPGLLKAAVLNLDRFENFKIFELGRIYYHKRDFKEKKQPQKSNDKSKIKFNESFFGRDEDHQEEFILAGLVVSQKDKSRGDSIFSSFLEIKNYISDFFNAHFLNACMEMSLNENYKNLLHPGLSVEIKLNSIAQEAKSDPKNSMDRKNIGYIGLVHPKVIRHYGLKRDVIVFQLNISKIWEEYLKLDRKYHTYTPPSIYPPVFFEFTIVVKESQSTHDVLKKIGELNYEEIRLIELINVYKGTPLANNEEALSYRIHFVSDQGTLDSDRINEMQDNIVSRLNSAGFPLRT